LFIYRLADGTAIPLPGATENPGFINSATIAESLLPGLLVTLLFKIRLLIPCFSITTVLNLTPDLSNAMCGRSAFRIHGASKKHPLDSSEGCIIAPVNVRKSIWASGDRELTVK
jgi:hypothetical protein